MSRRTSSVRSVCSLMKSASYRPSSMSDLAHGEGEGRVGAELDGHVVVGVDRRGAVVGGDGHDLGAVVAGLGDEVVPGDVRVDRVAVPDEHQLGVEPVVDAGRRIELAEGDVDAGAEVVDLGLDVGG